MRQLQRCARPSKALWPNWATSFFAILLGVSVIVAMKNITFFSEKAVAYQLDALGANILMAIALKLTEGATVPLLGRTFTVSAILPQTGTADDARAAGLRERLQHARAFYADLREKMSR